MGQAIRQPGDEFFARIARMERRLAVLERMPSGVQSISVRQLGQVPTVTVRRTTDYAVVTTPFEPTPWEVATVNRGSMWDVSDPESIVISDAGAYLAMARWAGGGSHAVHVNGVQVSESLQSTTGLPAQLFDLVAGDVVTLDSKMNGGAGTLSASTFVPYFTLVWQSH